MVEPCLVQACPEFSQLLDAAEDDPTAGNVIHSAELHAGLTLELVVDGAAAL